MKITVWTDISARKLYRCSVELSETPEGKQITISEGIMLTRPFEAELPTIIQNYNV